MKPFEQICSLVSLLCCNDSNILSSYCCSNQHTVCKCSATSVVTILNELIAFFFMMTLEILVHNVSVFIFFEEVKCLQGESAYLHIKLEFLQCRPNNHPRMVC